jgi:predicted enzyme related to lactoylglutathione lyase/GNAT superfamily N-acetyltransferase
MNLNQVSIPSTDVERSATFYRQLGLVQIVANHPQYARFECTSGNSTLSLMHVDEMSRAAGFVIYFECENLDAKVEALRQQGIDFQSLPEDKPWLWREAHLTDPDGNAVCLFHAGTNRRYPPWRLKAGATPEAEAGRIQSAHGLTLVVEDDPSEIDVHTIAQGLTQHALPVIHVPGFRPVGVFARDARGTLVAGVFGLLNWNWLYVSLFWVGEPLRRSGLGCRLLTELERVAVERGCTHAHLDTFSYQARPFYEKQGYEVFGVLDEYPPGHKRFFMKKTLSVRTDS